MKKVLIGVLFAIVCILAILRILAEKGHTMAMNRHIANVLISNASECALTVIEVPGENAVAKKTCNRSKKLEIEQYDIPGFIEINAEREDHGDVFACIEFVAGTQNAITDIIASRTAAIGGENAVYCLSVNKTAWGSCFKKYCCNR